MKIVFMLHHYSIKDDKDTAKMIGFYDSLEEANKAIERSSKLPGFKDCPEGYIITEIKIDQDLIDCKD